MNILETFLNELKCASCLTLLLLGESGASWNTLNDGKTKGDKRVQCSRILKWSKFQKLWYIKLTDLDENYNLKELEKNIIFLSKNIKFLAKNV